MDDMYYESETETETEGDEESSSSIQSALLPKSLLGGKTAGDTITLKVVKVWDDEIEVAPVGDGPPAAPKRMSAEEEIDEMAMA